MKKEKIPKEIQSIAPNLAKQKQQSPPFKVPANYFEQFESQLMDNIEQQSSSNHTAKVRTLSYWLSRAAAIFVLGIGAFYLLNQETTTSTDLFADVTTEEINQYLAEHIYEIEEEELFEEHFNQETLLEEDFSQEEIDLYLEEHLDELEDIDLDNLL